MTFKEIERHMPSSQKQELCQLAALRNVCAAQEATGSVSYFRRKILPGGSIGLLPISQERSVQEKEAGMILFYKSTGAPIMVASEWEKITRLLRNTLCLRN